ncbi:unnamed protein product [Calicophoron daubneyi]|uniref:Lipoprotein n=1 Tax=Calicophoron daubneyi TaxID=300641 RepID=A0AAV2T5J9_CALDB
MKFFWDLVAFVLIFISVCGQDEDKKEHYSEEMRMYFPEECAGGCNQLEISEFGYCGTLFHLEPKMKALKVITPKYGIWRELFLFRNWSRPLSRYEVIPLWHSLDPKYGNSGPESVKNHLYIALLRMQDYRLFPIKPAEGGKFTLYWDFDHKSRGIEVLSVAIYNLLRKSK